MSVLRLQNVTHDFDRVRALDDVTLSVEAGEIVCLMGPSGCGKSTLLRVAAGLEPLQTGEVWIDDKCVAEGGRELVPSERRSIGFMFQDFALFPHLSVADNVGFGLSGLGGAERRTRTFEILENVGMREYADVYPHTLSGGQQQRVALARALAPKPRVLLLDEPFSGLDARLRHRLAEQFWLLLKDGRTATIVVTHDAEEGMFLADRVGILRDGQIEQTASPSKVYAAPQSAFVTRFLSDVNLFSGAVGESGEIETPVGAVPSNGLDAGTAVDVLVRQEGLRVHAEHAPDSAMEATVVRARPLGGRLLVVIRLARDPTSRAIYGRAPAQADLPEGASVHVSLDPRHVFVFPARNAT